jgi:flagellar hook assembly protein FlgD
VRIAIHDSEGRRVATLAAREEPAGERQARWDGRTRNGSGAPAGIYFAVVEFAGERRATRVVVTP